MVSVCLCMYVCETRVLFLYIYILQSLVVRELGSKTTSSPTSVGVY